MGITKGKGQKLVSDDSAALLSYAQNATTSQEANTSAKVEKQKHVQRKHSKDKETQKVKADSNKTSALVSFSSMTKSKDGWTRRTDAIFLLASLSIMAIFTALVASEEANQERQTQAPR